MNTKKITDPIKEAWEENPILVLTAGAGVLFAAAKIIDALSAAQGRRAYARQIDYKVRSRR